MKIFKRLAAIITAMSLALVMCMMSAGAESIFDSAKEIKSGKKYTVNASFPNDQKPCYAINVDSKGKMSIKLTSDAEFTVMKVYDSDYSEILPTDINTTSGSSTTYSDRLLYDKNTKMAAATYTYNVKSGKYYILFSYIPYLRNNSVGTYKMTVQTPGSDDSDSSASSTKNTITIYMEKGDKIDLGATSGGKNLGNAKWSSSDEKIVKVNSKGKITAVKEGTAILTWKNGNTTFSFYVTVE